MEEEKGKDGRKYEEERKRGRRREKEGRRAEEGKKRGKRREAEPYKTLRKLYFHKDFQSH